MLAAAVLVFGACGDSGDLVEQVIEESMENEGVGGQVDIDSSDDSFSIVIEGDDGETVQIQGDDEGGSVVISGGDNEGVIVSGVQVPEGFPLPIADGCVVIGGTTIEGPGGTMMSVTLEMDASEATAVADFYEAEFKKLGFSVMRTTGSGQGTQSILLTGVDEGGSDRGASMMMQVEGGKATAGISIGGGT